MKTGLAITLLSLSMYGGIYLALPAHTPSTETPGTGALPTDPAAAPGSPEVTAGLVDFTHPPLPFWGTPMSADFVDSQPVAIGPGSELLNGLPADVEFEVLDIQMFSRIDPRILQQRHEDLLMEIE